MKNKNIIYLILFFLILNFDTLCENFSSKTFFSMQPIFRPTSPECVAIKRDELRYFDDEKRYSLDLTLYGGESVNNETLAQYFMPFGKTKLLCGELGSNAVRQGKADVIANYFGVLTYKPFIAGEPADFTNYTFESEISFVPSHSFSGLTFTYRQHLSRHINEGLWLEVVIPFEHVRNEIKIKEDIITKGGPGGNDPQVPEGNFANMKQAFAQPAWQYGKIDGAKTKNGIADLYLRIGLIYVREEPYFLESFLGFSFPTGNEPTNEFVFEPVIGQNNHFTMFMGTTGGFKVLMPGDNLCEV